MYFGALFYYKCNNVLIHNLTTPSLVFFLLSNFLAFHTFLCNFSSFFRSLSFTGILHTGHRGLLMEEITLLILVITMTVGKQAGYLILITVVLCYNM